jgi:hypothetical protein
LFQETAYLLIKASSKRHTSISKRNKSSRAGTGQLNKMDKENLDWNCNYLSSVI